jgi:ABC-type microcin C transport system permease subunit YejB
MRLLNRLRQVAERAAHEAEAAERRRQAEADPDFLALAADVAERYGLDERQAKRYARIVMATRRQPRP